MALLNFYTTGGLSALCSGGGAAVAACSGRSVSSAGGNGAYATDQTAPASGVASTLGSSDSLRVGTNVMCAPAIAAWAGGTYGVTFDVTSANMNLTLNEIHLCRVDSSCGAIATIGSLTGIARGLGSTGAVTHNVTGSADTHGSTDILVVVFVFTNGAMSSQSVTAAVTIATPIDDGVAGFTAKSRRSTNSSIGRVGTRIAA